MGGPQKGQRFGGRKKGTPNKATTERLIIAAEVEKRRTAKAVGRERELGVEKLAKLGDIAEGAAALVRPTSPQEIAAGVPPNPQGNLSEFREWIRLAGTLAKWRAEYETPKLMAMAIAAPPPVQRDEAKRFTLTVFEGGRPLPKAGEILPPKDEIAS
jgi:hypothetical protein